MPKIIYGDHLIEFMFRLREWSHTEIQARCAYSKKKKRLLLEEADIIVAMGKAYDSMREKARKPNCPQPHTRTKLASQADWDAMLACAR